MKTFMAKIQRVRGGKVVTVPHVCDELHVVRNHEDNDEMVVIGTAYVGTRGTKVLFRELLGTDATANVVISVNQTQGGDHGA